MGGSGNPAIVRDSLAGSIHSRDTPVHVQLCTTHILSGDRQSRST